MEDFFRKNVTDLALIQLNKKYKDFATGPDEFDNQGFVCYLFKELFNIDIAHGNFMPNNLNTNNITNLKIYNDDEKIEKKYLIDLKPGDLLLFKENLPKINNRDYYLGIYLGEGNFIHASPEENRIIISNINNRFQKELAGTLNIISRII